LLSFVITSVDRVGLQIDGRTSRPHWRDLMADDLEDTIRQNAQGPAKAAGDAGSVEQHKLSEQIEADKYLASKEAAKSKRRGLIFNKLVPPGAD
jgi:hypothetical protein